MNENNSFRRETLKKWLSRNYSNSLFQNHTNINLKDNNNKSTIKIFEQENISTKRKSVSTPKKYYKNNFEGRIDKKHLSKISEVPILNPLLKEISDFHNL